VAILAMVLTTIVTPYGGGNVVTERAVIEVIV
jgi:hypothetical protein